MLNKLIYELVETVHENGITYWTSSGTLIGAIREKDTIPWDADADFCMWDHDLPRFLRLKEKFSKQNVEIFNTGIYYKLYLRNGTGIHKDFKYPYADIFFYKKMKLFIQKI